jgi:hypothetical protein
MAAFASALATAVPVIDKIVSAIWPSGDSKKKKAKDEAAPAVSSLKDASSEALRSLSDELSIIATLLEACLPAEDGVVSIQAVLRANRKGELSESDKLIIKKSWDLIKNNLKKIGDKETKKAVDEISDVFTRSTFLDVVNAGTDDIEEDLKAWALADLKNDVDVLYGYLNKVNRVAVQVVSGISSGLGKLSASQSKKSAAVA